jgi:predicted MFS family arabinose efflux permease
MELPISRRASASTGLIHAVGGGRSPAFGVPRSDSPSRGKNSDASKEGGGKALSARTLHGLDWLNFFLADVQTGVGPFLAIYLASYKWNEESVGRALTVGGIAGIVMQTPAGALVDRLRSKRALISVGIVALAAGALLVALVPTFWSVMSAQVAR